MMLSLYGIVVKLIVVTEDNKILLLLLLLLSNLPYALYTLGMCYIAIMNMLHRYNELSHSEIIFII